MQSITEVSLWEHIFDICIGCIDYFHAASFTGKFKHQHIFQSQLLRTNIDALSKVMYPNARFIVKYLPCICYNKSQVAYGLWSNLQCEFLPDCVGEISKILMDLLTVNYAWLKSKMSIGTTAFPEIIPNMVPRTRLLLFLPFWIQ